MSKYVNLTAISSWFTFPLASESNIMPSVDPLLLSSLEAIPPFHLFIVSVSFVLICWGIYILFTVCHKSTESVVKCFDYSKYIGIQFGVFCIYIGIYHLLCMIPFINDLMQMTKQIIHQQTKT